MTVQYERGHLSRTMANRLALARSAQGWTLKRAAAECGCSITTIWGLENAQRVPSVALAGNVCRAYRLSREDTIALMSEAVRGAGKDKPSKRREAQAKAAASN